MKIKFWDRMILFFGALLAACSGLFLIVCGIRMLGGEAIATPWLVISLVLGVLCLGLCAGLICVARKYANDRNAFVVQHTDNGQLRIAVKAIENLVNKCIAMHEEIQANSLLIHHSRHDVTVDLSISLANNISIPLAVASLQKQIKQYLVASSGIDVKEVRVSVESTRDEAEMTQGEGFSAPMPTVNLEEEIAPAEKKMPLHRRLFGKADQPVTLPEPPAPQDGTEALIPEREAVAAEETSAEQGLSDEAPIPQDAAPVDALQSEEAPFLPREDEGIPAQEPEPEEIRNINEETQEQKEEACHE